MFKLMSAVFGLAIGAGVLATPVVAQNLSQQRAVVEQCALVAAEEVRAENTQDHALRGFCINATGAYLISLQAASLSAEDFGTQLATLVVDLTELLNVRQCQLESEIAQAIMMVSAVAQDPEQEAQIVLISQTVSSCDFGITAAVQGDDRRSIITGDPSSYS